MADQPEKMEEELQLLRERRRLSRCHRTYSLFLEGLEGATGLPRKQAERVFVQVLCALEVPLVRDTADEWRARLPVRVQEAIEACASRRRATREPFHLEVLLSGLEAELGVERGRAESVTRAMLATLRARLTESEAAQLEDALPWELRALWGHAC